MKYAITGHTQGIGKRAFERLSPDIIGFSKSTGYDITTDSGRARIIEEAKDCDIFINNATDNFGQVDLFIDLFRAWKDQPKLIINVGSRIAELLILPDDRLDLLNYQAQKLILKNMSFRVKGLCKVKYKWFAYVGTKNILTKYPHFNQNDYITEDQAVDIILS
jgi:hypothetical protein